MSLLDDFVLQFISDPSAVKDIYKDLGEIVIIGRDFFSIPSELDSLRKTITKRINREASYAGILLGSIVGRSFRPACHMIDLIARYTDRWIEIDETSEWLFLCARDVFGKSVVRANVDFGLAIVLNKKKDVLGYGKIISKLRSNDSIFLKNIWDKGDFLRREMDKHKRH